MNLAEIPLLGVLRERMSWLNARQGVLSQNVANADTPGYTTHDLKPLDFEAVLKRSTQGNDFDSGLRVTNPKHIEISNSATSPFGEDDTPDTQGDATGNTVSLEEEMIKVADTQAQYQTAANLYSKAVDLLRMAIGRPGG